MPCADGRKLGYRVKVEKGLNERRWGLRGVRVHGKGGIGLNG